MGHPTTAPRLQRSRDTLIPCLKRHSRNAMHLASFLVSLVAATLLHGQFSAPPWFSNPPPLPAPAGKVIHVATPQQLLDAVEQIGPGGTIQLADGHYPLPRVLVLREKQEITLRGATDDPSRVVLSGRGWDSQVRSDDILHIGRCDGVTIANMTFTDCHSYGIKVEAENAPRNIHIVNCHFRNIGTRAIKGSAGQDPETRAVHGSIRHCHFENTKIPPDTWLFDGDYIAAIDMMALDDWVVSDNVFRNIRGRNGAARAAIFLWVRSQNLVVERNLIVDCDRGIAFGNPGLSTAHLPGQRPLHVSHSTIRNNVIVGGPDCGIELWHAEDLLVAHNSIWRPERNWHRGIRIGAGTARVDIANNLVHGGVVFDGGTAQLRQNLAGRLDHYFVDPTVGNLALTPQATGALGQGIFLAEVAEDIGRQPRNPQPNLGAWETPSPPPAD
jgi:hypothetical protein